MRIENQNQASMATGQTGRTTGAEGLSSTMKSNGGAASTASDGIALSDLAGTLSQAMRTGSADRSQRVAELSQTVQSGSYTVDAAAVSRAYMDHVFPIGADADADGK